MLPSEEMVTREAYHRHHSTLLFAFVSEGYFKGRVYLLSSVSVRGILAVRFFFYFFRLVP